MEPRAAAVPRTSVCSPDASRLTAADRGSPSCLGERTMPAGSHVPDDDVRGTSPWMARVAGDRDHVLQVVGRKKNRWRQARRCAILPLTTLPPFHNACTPPLPSLGRGDRRHRVRPPRGTRRHPDDQCRNGLRQRHSKLVRCSHEHDHHGLAREADGIIPRRQFSRVTSRHPRFSAYSRPTHRRRSRGGRGGASPGRRRWRASLPPPG